jgi:pyruvate kinase
MTCNRSKRSSSVKARHIPVIAKIEKPEAVENLASILEAADGIMVARGDLGVELQPEFSSHHSEIRSSTPHEKNKPVITATQMLETMSTNPIPTRAEASDVANAIFDGTDAVMLSGETASGRYPVKALRMMAKIATETENSPFMRYNNQFEPDQSEDLITHAVAQSAANILMRSMHAASAGLFRFGQNIEADIQAAPLQTRIRLYIPPGDL